MRKMFIVILAFVALALAEARQGKQSGSAAEKRRQRYAEWKKRRSNFYKHLRERWAK